MFRRILCICVAGLLITMGGCVSSQSQLMEERVRRTVTPSGYKGPFGYDSQKSLSSGGLEYYLGIIVEVDHEKNSDGTWYVESCELYVGPAHANYVYFINFEPPYPQQNDLKVGDFIGFTCQTDVLRTMGIVMINYNSGKILDHISSQSLQIGSVPGLSTPVQALENPHVTGVVMALQVIKNENPEPDNPADFLIDKLVIKCADGNLYLVGLSDSYSKYPSAYAFGEGDIVTVTQRVYIKELRYLIASW